eukprot:5372703-Amphidinium_carterae.1
MACMCVGVAISSQLFSSLAASESPTEACLNSHSATRRPVRQAYRSPVHSSCLSLLGLLLVTVTVSWCFLRYDCGHQTWSKRDWLQALYITQCTEYSFHRGSLHRTPTIWIHHLLHGFWLLRAMFYVAVAVNHAGVCSLASSLTALASVDLFGELLQTMEHLTQEGLRVRMPVQEKVLPTVPIWLEIIVSLLLGDKPAIQLTFGGTAQFDQPLRKMT